MQTIVVTTHKGGVGKTMLAAHIAWHYAEQGRRVLAVDLDMQGNLGSALGKPEGGLTASRLFAEGAAVPLPETEPGQIVMVASDRELSALGKSGMTIVAPFVSNLKALGGRFDVCVIDTNAEVNYLNIASLSAATHAITPTDMSSFARDGVHSILQVVEKVRRSQNPSLQFLGIVANRFASGKTADVQNLQALIDTFGPGVVFPAVLRDGNAFKEAMEPVRGDDASGARAVWHDRKPAAQGHIENMVRLLGELDRQLRLDPSEEAETETEKETAA